MPYTVAGKNLMLNALRGVNPTTPITHVSAHSASPGETGANEIGTRQPIAFNAASGGALDDSTNGAAIPVPGGSTVSHIGFWNGASGGTFLAWTDEADESFTNAGTYTLTDADLDLNL